MIRHDTDAQVDRVHREVWELLPWYVNGTLDGQESQRVARHLSTCSACQTELTRCHDLAAAVHAAEEVAWAPSREHLSRVLARIDAADAPRAWAGSWWQQLCTRCLGYRLWLQRTPSPVRWALATQGALILLLLGVIVWQAPFAPEPFYRTLADVNEQAPQDRVRIRVVFTPDMTAQEIRTLLHAIGGTIIKGPSSLGVYTVEVASAGTAPDRASMVLDAIRAHRKVRLAEPALTR
jgi:anti-sigma factor RsiW